MLLIRHASILATSIYRIEDTFVSNFTFCVPSRSPDHHLNDRICHVPLRRIPRTYETVLAVLSCHLIRCCLSDPSTLRPASSIQTLQPQPNNSDCNSHYESQYSYYHHQVILAVTLLHPCPNAAIILRRIEHSSQCQELCAQILLVLVIIIVIRIIRHVDAHAGHVKSCFRSQCGTDLIIPSIEDKA